MTSKDCAATSPNLMYHGGIQAGVVARVWIFAFASVLACVAQTATSPVPPEPNWDWTVHYAAQRLRSDTVSWADNAGHDYVLIGDDTLSVNVIHQNDPRRNDFYDGTLWRRMGPGDGPLSPGLVFGGAAGPEPFGCIVSGSR